MKIKLTNMLRGKERKKRKTRYAKLIEVDKEGLYTLKIYCKGKATVGKANKGINVEIIIIGLKIKIKKRGKHRPAKAQHRGRGL